MMIEEKKTEFDNILQSLTAEFVKLRTSRANPAMIEDLKVDYYGTSTPIKQLASITVPEARQLLIIPWDKTSLPSLEKAIRDANLGLNPANEGDKIRVRIPDLTEERRLELAKIVGRLAEQSRVKVRALREGLLKDIKNQEAAGKIREDERFRQQEALQKIVDEYNQKIKDLSEAKEKEIMTV